MAKGFIGASGYNAYLGTIKMRAGYIGAIRVYSAVGNIVTYHVDTGVTYQEEVDSGASCLAPKTFTPSKSGWTFVGWRLNSEVSANVLSELIMEDSPITLYAVFRQAVTITYYNNSTTASNTSGYRYYNNGNTVNPSFTLSQASRSGWTARGWSTNTAGNGGITYNNATAFERDTNITLYGMYQQTITVTYYNGSSTASTTSGTRYYNSGNGNIVNPSFTLTQASKSGWTTMGWSTSTAGNGGITYNNGASFTRDSNITLYGMYQQTITVTYYNNSTTAKTTSGTRYYNSNGNVVDPSFTLTQASRSGWTVRGWSTSTAGNGGISYNNGASFTRNSNVTLYGMYYQTITLTYYNGSTTSASTSGTRYYNSGSGNYSNPTFTLTPATLSGWTFRGWATSSAAAAGITYSSISNTALAANTTVYAAYSQTITLSYSGNGSTSGTTVSQTGTRYWNTGNVSNPSFTLRSNGFTRTNYTFSKWALGSTSGTQYAAGAAITLSTNTTMYALWLASSLTVFSRSIYYEAPEINNRSYVTFSGGFSSSILLVGNITDPGTGTININLGQYRKATITFYIFGNDMDEKSGRYGSVTFDGATSGNGIYYARANSSPSGTLVMDNSGAISAYATCYNSRCIITMSIISIVLTA